MNRQNPLFSALGRIPSGIFIVTVGHGENATGMLASWVQQCSFDPPLLSMAVARDRPVNTLLVDDAPFVVHILAEDQTDLIAHFGRGFAPGERAFTGLEITESSGSVPILKESLAYLDCRVAGRFAPGDHDIIIGRIEAGGVQNDGKPMIHVRKQGSHY